MCSTCYSSSHTELRFRSVSRPVFWFWFWFTWLVSAKPLVEDGIGEGVQQDKDGVIRGEMCLTPGSVEKEVRQVMEAADHRVVRPLRGAVA